MNKRILLFALITFLSAGIHAQINFETGTLAAALEKAKLENKPVFVDVFAVWCGPCKRMAATAFTDPKVAEFYNKHFINVKVDGEKNDGPAVMSQFGITAYPTLLYFNADGSLAKKVVGGQDANQLLKQGIALADPESSPSLGARKAYHASKKKQADLNKLIAELSASDDDSLAHYTKIYYTSYPKLDLNDKAELEVFMWNENDPNKPVSKEFLDHPERVTSELYKQKLNMFIQESFARSVESADFAIVETSIRTVYPYLQKTVADMPKLDEYIEYARTEFNKNK